MAIKAIQFKNRRGLKIAARLDLPDGGEPSAFALVAHCFTCTKNLKAIAYLSRALAEMHIAALRFDFSGLGESEGDFAETNLSSNVTDLIDAARFLERYYRPPEVLIGHSYGGVAVLSAAPEIPSSCAIAVIGTPSRPEHILRLVGSAEPMREGGEEGGIILEGRTFQIKKQFFDDVVRDNFLSALSRLRHALLILHSPFDDTVGIEHATQLFAAARHPKSFVSLDRADHLMTRKEDAIYAGRLIATWASRYLEQCAAPH